ncbi:MAG TPA: toprim domain-containing protein, partial [Candidatus Limnocylindrales bacterium]|nr:toprim domain-containing protein [Candidatus Limnocylindrales bacterium]
VEGYTDALMAHQAGFDNVVASLGTALTPGQVALLTRYAKRIALAYDVDAAGQKAGTFGVQALEGLIGQLAATESGVELDEVRVVRLPDGKDPDEVVRESPDLWREEVRTAQPIVDYLIDTYATTYDLKTPGGKARFVDALMPTIRAVPNPVMRDGWLQRVRQVSGVEERVLLEVMRSGRSATGIGDAASTREGRFSADAVTAAPDALRVSDILRGVLPQEQELLRLMLLVPEVQVRITDAIGPDRLPNTVARELFRAVVLAREPDDAGVRPPFSLTALVQGLDPETASLAQALVARRHPDAHDLTSDELAYEVERLVIDLEERALDERHEFIQDALAEAEQAGDADAAGRRLLEIQAINDQRRSLHRRRDQTRLLVSPSRR